MPVPLNPQLDMVTLDVFALREPVSKRAYTCLRLRTRSGATGYGECSRISSSDLSLLRSAIQNKEASSFESIRRGLTVTPRRLPGSAWLCSIWSASLPTRPSIKFWADPLEPGARSGADRRGNRRCHSRGRYTGWRGRP